MQLRSMYINYGLSVSFAAVLLFGMYPSPAFATSYVFPPFTNYETFTEILEPEQRQMYYGNLLGFPHTYSFLVRDEMSLQVEILTPVIESRKGDLNAIIVKKQMDGSVVEVARMNASTASEEEWYDSVGNDTYQRGPSYHGELTEGEYLLEINSPTNDGKYVLNIGTEEQPLFRRLINEVTRIYPVKRFFDKSPWAVFESPLFYIPTILLLFLGFAYVIKRRQNAL